MNKEKDITGGKSAERVTGYCRECGAEFIGSEKKRFCSHKCCASFHNKRKRRIKNDLNRKITETTKMLVCVYDAEGISISQTADFLRRPEAVIAELLEKCKESGEYNRFISNSPFLKSMRR